MPFLLHPQLEADSTEVMSLPLSRVRLMNDRSWPWLLVVPAREDLTELFELEEHDRRIFIEEIALAAMVLRDLFQPHKINVAALGNQVSQLHCHVIARFHHDPAWPRPVWGTLPAIPYAAREVDTIVGGLRDAFSRNLPQFEALREPGGDNRVGGEEGAGLWSMFGFTDR